MTEIPLGLIDKLETKGRDYESRKKWGGGGGGGGGVNILESPS